MYISLCLMQVILTTFQQLPSSQEKYTSCSPEFFVANRTKLKSIIFTYTTFIRVSHPKAHSYVVIQYIFNKNLEYLN